jgi:hypothetical protein
MVSVCRTERAIDLRTGGGQPGKSTTLRGIRFGAETTVIRKRMWPSRLKSKEGRTPIRPGLGGPCLRPWLEGNARTGSSPRAFQTHVGSESDAPCSQAFYGSRARRVFPKPMLKRPPFGRGCGHHGSSPRRGGLRSARVWAVLV